MWCVPLPEGFCAGITSSHLLRCCWRVCELCEVKASSEKWLVVEVAQHVGSCLTGAQGVKSGIMRL